MKVFAVVLWGLLQRARTQHVYFLMYSPPDRANVEWKNLAKLVRIQINSSAWGSSALHFYKCDPQTTNYELQNFLTSLFLQLFWVETKTSCRARFYGLISDCKRSHLTTFSAVYSGVLMSIWRWFCQQNETSREVSFWLGRAIMMLWLKENSLVLNY